ncbi:MAG TPA: tetratricopeptide repeat protein [Pyrinomonadaceae bacterium]|jgi:TonB family protein
MKKTSLLSALALMLLVGVQARAESRVDSFGWGQATQAAGQSDVAADSPELKEAAQQTAAAVKFYRERKFDDALTAAKRALELREKVLPEDHALIKSSLNNLGQIYLVKENYSDALKVFLRLEAAYEKSLPPGHENYDLLVRRLALIYFYLGKDSEAEKRYRQLLAQRETARGAHHPQVAEALFAYASFYQFRGKEKEAEPLYARAIAIWEKQKDSDQTLYMTALERYACMLRKSDRESEAETLETRARESISKEYDSKLAESVKGGVLNGKAISKPPPGYPVEAKNQRQSGTVVVNLLVDETGRVLQACAISGPKLLRAASERAAYAARFSPTLLGGVPVKVRGIITYNYVLQ